MTPHIAQNTAGRHSAIDGRTTRHPGYASSQRTGKRIEEAFGWAKTVAGLRQVRHAGTVPKSAPRKAMMLLSQPSRAGFSTTSPPNPTDTCQSSVHFQQPARRGKTCSEGS